MARYQLNLQKSGASYYHYVTIDIWESSQSIVDNTTTLGYSVVFNASDSAFYHYNYCNQLWLSINDTALCSCTNVDPIYISAGESKQIASGYITVPHNSDGTKSVSVYCRFYQSCGVYDNSNTWTYTCTTIPRAGSIGTVTGTKTLGNTVYIYVNKQSTSFTHELRYTCGSVDGQISSNVTGSSTYWNVPKSLASQNTSGEVLAIKLYLVTKNGSTVIGTKYKYVTFTIQSDAVLTLGNLTITENNTSKLPQDKWSGVYVQNISKLSNAITASQGASYGATLKAAEIRIGSATAKGTIDGWNISFAQIPITVSGNINVIVIVQDSRGRIATKIVAIYVHPYNTPSVSGNIYRSDASGNEDPNGAYAKYTLSAIISSIKPGTNQLNTYNATLKETPSSGSSKTRKLVESGSVMTIELTDLIEANIDNTYAYEFSIKDQFNTSKISFAIGSAYTLVDYHSSGKGIAFGKVSQEEGLFDIGMDLNVDGPATFNDGLSGNLTGSINDYKDGEPITFSSVDSMVTSPTALPIWKDHTLGRISAANLRKFMGIDAGKSKAHGVNVITTNFNFTFKSAPYVVAQYAKTGDNVTGNRGSLKIYNITTTGFQTIIGGSDDNTNRDIMWVAIGTPEEGG